MKGKPIGRRTALKYMALIGSSAGGSQFLANWLPLDSEVLAATSPASLVTIGTATPKAEPSSQPYSPQFFTDDEFRTVEILTEMIIPTDETPGAKEARIAAYIDFLVFSAAEFKPSMQREWIDGLKTLDQVSSQKYSRPFLQLSASEREDLLTAISLPERDPNATNPGFPFFRTLKATTVDTFYTSRVGLFDVLHYKGLTFLFNSLGCTNPPSKT